MVGKNILFLCVKMKPGFVLLLLPFCSKDKIVFLEWLKGAKSGNKIILFHFRMRLTTKKLKRTELFYHKEASFYCSHFVYSRILFSWNATLVLDWYKIW